jgi:hypothetical protein
VLTGSLFLSFAAVIRFHEPHYAILLTPVTDILTAVLLYTVIQERAQMLNLRGYATTLAAWGLIAASVAINLNPILNNTQGSYDLILSEMRRVIPEGSKVFGWPIYWFARPHDTYYSQHQLIYYQRYYPGSTLDEGLGYYAPDYMIVSENRETDLYLSPLLERWARHYIGPDVSNADLENLAARHGKLIGKMTNKWYGYFNLYKMDWSGISNKVP